MLIDSLVLGKIAQNNMFPNICTTLMFSIANNKRPVLNKQLKISQKFETF